MKKKYKKNLDICFVFCYNKNMEEFVSFLIFELFLKNPLFWLLIILGIMSLFFYKKIVGAKFEATLSPAFSVIKYIIDSQPSITK